MEDKVKIVNAFGLDSYIVTNLMQKSPVFKDRMDRYRSSEVSTLIIVNDEIAGFVNLVREKRNYDFLFLDMYILEEYRNRKIGEKVFKILQNHEFKDPIIAETEMTNIGANKTAYYNCKRIARIDYRNIYLVQKDKLDKFINNNYIEKLTKHFEKDSDKKLIKLI